MAHSAEDLDAVRAGLPPEVAANAAAIGASIGRAADALIEAEARQVQALLLIALSHLGGDEEHTALAAAARFQYVEVFDQGTRTGEERWEYRTASGRWVVMLRRLPLHDARDALSVFTRPVFDAPPKLPAIGYRLSNVWPDGRPDVGE